MDMLSAKASELISYVKSSCEQRSLAQSAEISVGVEHEFFIFKKSGGVADWGDAQNFFKKMAHQRGWVFSSGTGMDAMVSRQYSRNRFAKIKFEYPPHLLEIAFTYDTNLNVLEAGFTEVWQQVSSAAEASDLMVVNTPFLPQSAIEQVIQLSSRPEYDYSRYRSSIADGGDPNPLTYQFPLYTASTQIHVGGINWWRDFSAIENIYAFESILWIYGSLLLTSCTSEAASLYTRRRELYTQCFPTLQLVGFPDFDKWTLDHWARAMISGPMIGDADFLSEGLSYAEADQSIPISDVFARLRDCQYVRPRIMGTIEFRGDAAVPTVNAVMALAALRLGICLNAHRSLVPSYDLARQRWIKGVFADNFEENYRETIEMIYETLVARGLGEERFLSKLLPSVGFAGNPLEKRCGVGGYNT